MANPVIKLEPMRMGSINSAGTASVDVSQKYLPPNMRGEVATGPIKVDLSVDNFPTLGSAPKKVVGWGKHVIKSSPLAIPNTTITIESEATLPQNMKDKIKEQIRQTELEEEQKQKPREEDPYKMTYNELLEGGWEVLPLNAESVKQAKWRLNTPFRVSLTCEDYYE